MSFILSAWRRKALGVMVVGMILLAASAAYYRHHYHQAVAKQYQFAQLATIYQQTINDMQVRQQAMMALDARYTQELTDAKATIDRLERRVIAGQQRLRVHARCQPLSTTAPAARLDDAARARLTDAAQRDYFILRKRIETARRQIAGLQDYVRFSCLAPQEERK